MQLQDTGVPPLAPVREIMSNASVQGSNEEIVPETQFETEPTEIPDSMESASEPQVRNQY